MEPFAENVFLGSKSTTLKIRCQYLSAENVTLFYPGQRLTFAVNKKPSRIDQRGYYCHKTNICTVFINALLQLPGDKAQVFAHRPAGGLGGAEIMAWVISLCCSKSTRALSGLE